MTDARILTPEQVADFRQRYGFDATDRPRRMCDSHEALREQLAEAQEDVRALASAIELPEHFHSHFIDGGHPGCMSCTGWKRRKEAMARPGFKRVMEETP